MKIAVLTGGISTERNVSLTSGKMIANALRENGHEVCLVDSFLGLPKIPQNLSTLFSKEIVDYDVDIDTTVLTHEKVFALRPGNSKDYFGEHVLDVLKEADFVFLALHGEDGENGKVQAFLDLENIKYTGSDFLGAVMAMNKAKSKEIMKYHNLPTADFITINRGEKIPESFPFPYPVVVKPANGGSSVGTVIADSYKSALQAIEDDFAFDNCLVVEQFIKGREFSQSVLGDGTLPPIEITVNDGWYDFDHKFKTGNTTVFTTPPKNFSKENEIAMSELSLKLGKVLGLSNYFRIDYLLNETGFYIIEANVLPGLTPLSLIPREAKVIGMSYQELIEEILKIKISIYDNE